MDLKSVAGLHRLTEYLAHPDSRYPLQIHGVLAGLVIGLGVSVVLLSPLAGLAVFVLFASAGLLWRKDEPPVLVYCIAYQWVFVAMGFFYDLFTGNFPSRDFPAGDLNGATFISLIGFLTITLGLRVGLTVFERRISVKRRTTAEPPRYNVQLLFWIVIVIFTVNWFLEILPREIAFNQAQIISSVLSTREILLCLLFITILSQRKGYRLGILAGIFVTLPQATSQHSAFSWVFIFIGMALLREWRPWLKTRADRQRNRRIVLGGFALGVVLLFMALVWQGGVKQNWRSTLQSESEAELSSPVRKMATLASIVEEVYANLNWSEAVDSLAERLSGTLYFSHALNYVPRVAPYENGTLTLRAINHTFKPRILFPDKADLGSNSWLIWQYTGLPAAGEESNTSIGLTYMAEFYVDYGHYFMFVPLFIWGLIIGVVYSGIFLISPSQLLSCATVMVLLPQPFASYEGEIAYMLGGLLQTGLVFGVVLYFIGPFTHRLLLRSRKSTTLPLFRTQSVMSARE